MNVCLSAPRFHFHYKLFSFWEALMSYVVWDAQDIALWLQMLYINNYALCTRMYQNMGTATSQVNSIQSKSPCT